MNTRTLEASVVAAKSRLPSPLTVQSLADEDVRVSASYPATPAGEGRLAVRDFVFLRGDEEIAGRVVDLHDNPVPDVFVRVMRINDVVPDFWIGHSRESHVRTDNLGPSYTVTKDVEMVAAESSPEVASKIRLRLEPAWGEIVRDLGSANGQRESAYRLSHFLSDHSRNRLF